MGTQEIWNEFHQDLLKFIKKRVNNPYDTEDILQDVFRKIHESIQNLADQSRVQSWVYQISRNAITDFYRSQAKRNETEIQPLEQDDPPDEEEQTDNLNQVVSRWLSFIVEEMDDKYKEAILLTELGHLTQKQLAERLGISVSGAKSRVQRGREKIKEMLLACCHIEMDRLGNIIDYQRKTVSCSCCERQNKKSVHILRPFEPAPVLTGENHLGG